MFDISQTSENKKGVYMKKVSEREKLLEEIHARASLRAPAYQSLCYTVGRKNNDSIYYYTLLCASITIVSSAVMHKYGTSFLGVTILVMSGLLFALSTIASLFVAIATCMPKKWNEIKVDGEQCEEMLAYVNESDLCQEFRKEVLAKGREFRLGDLMLMRKIHQFEMKMKQMSRTQTACKKLHGV
jgi:hypothetical protein